MTTQLLSRRPHRPKPGLGFLDGLALAPSRVHEFCGPARRTQALIAARALDGPVFWIHPAWGPDRLHAEGILPFINPGRLSFVAPRRAEDLLWSMEEVLRAGCVPLVVCELPGLPGLTPVRRLHLAAETAAREQKLSTLGLILLPGAGGAPGVESRWHMAPAHHGDQARWRLERRRARMDPPKAWMLSQDGQSFTLATPPSQQPAGAVSP